MIKIASQWYVPDNWYGNNYRVILSQEFKNKTEAKKYCGLLCKYVKEKYKQKLKVDDVLFSENFIDYVYCSMGPSLYYNTYSVTIEELEKFKNKK